MHVEDHDNDADDGDDVDVVVRDDGDCHTPVNVEV